MTAKSIDDPLGLDIGWATESTFGINIFVAQSVLGLKLETIYRGIIPFVCLQVLAVVLCMVFPDIIFFLPRYWGLLD